MQSLERALERMVVGVFSRGSRANIRPIELGRRLVREMDDQRSVDVNGRRVVPNDFVLQLSQKDYDSFAEIRDVLQTELVEAAREYARSEGYHFMGAVRVELRADDEQKPGRFDVLATLRQAPGAAPGSAPAQPPAAPDDQAVPPAPTAVAPTASPAPADASIFAPTAAATTSVADDSMWAPRDVALVLPSGQRVPLGETTVTVGRLSASTIPLNDQNVSRRHAEIRPNRSNYVVVDLGSTNGTMVNGTRIHGETVLSDGDIISFGSTYVRFEAS